MSTVQKALVVILLTLSSITANVLKDAEYKLMQLCAITDLSLSANLI